MTRMLRLSSVAVMLHSSADVVIRGWGRRAHEQDAAASSVSGRGGDGAGSGDACHRPPEM